MDWCEDSEWEIKGKIHSIYVEKDSEDGKVWVSFKGTDLGGDDQEALDSAKKMKELYDGTLYGNRIITIDFVEESLFSSKVPPIYYWAIWYKKNNYQNLRSGSRSKF